MTQRATPRTQATFRPTNEGGSAEPFQDSIDVLQLVSAGHKSFFREQVKILEEKGVSCDVIAAMDEMTKERKRTIPLVADQYHNPFFYATRTVVLARKLLAKRSEQYDIVHANAGMIAPFAFLRRNEPIVLTLWGDDLLGDRCFGHAPTLTKYCANRADATIVRSDEMKHELDAQAHVVPAGVDLEKFRPMPRVRACETVGWNPDCAHVLFPYRPSKSKKRFPVAKRIVDRISPAFDGDILLHAVYDEPHEIMPLYMNAADVLLLPSLREGSPNTVKEAMACNLPVVSTNVGDVAQRLGGVSLSHVCAGERELEEALLEVLQTGERSDGREHVDDLGLDRMGNRLVEIYRSVMDSEQAL